MEITGFNESWWLGLSALHTLFAREHNLLCDELRAHYRGWSDDRIYHTARLIVSALIAKIHTVEWTPAILGTEAIDVGLSTNWNGPPANDWMTKLGIWLIDVHAATGIPKTKPDHHGAPYSLTEDFVTVYRLHPLMPDDYRFFDHQTGAVLGDRAFLDIQGGEADDEDARARPAQRALLVRHRPSGRDHAAQLTRARCSASSATASCIDLSVVDIVRTRRRGVPRYNDFRAGLHKPRDQRWEDLCDDPRPCAVCATSTARHRRGRHDDRPVRRDAARRASASPTPRSGSSS